MQVPERRQPLWCAEARSPTHFVALTANRGPSRLAPFAIRYGAGRLHRLNSSWLHVSRGRRQK